LPADRLNRPEHRLIQIRSNGKLNPVALTMIHHTVLFTTLF
jgi:hypothetical protein